VQIIVPKKSESDIEKALKSRTKVKWIYNEIEASTKYVFIPQSDNSGVRSLDDDQQRVFEESYKCRTSQIKYLIRAVKRALESQSYKRAEQHFDEEISRVEKATEKVKQELRALEERYGQEVFSEFAGEFEAFELQEKEFEREEKEFGREETQFQKHFNGMEEKYLTKRRSIENEQDKINSLTRKELEYNSTEEQINREFREEDSQLQREFDYKGGELGRDIEDGTKKLEEIKKRREAIPEEFRKLKTQERNEFANAKERFDVEERNLEETVRRELDRDIRRNPDRFSKGVGNILEAQRVGHAFQDAKRQEAIYKRARELFNKGTWENG
jgi:hypothetical protein